MGCLWNITVVPTIKVVKKCSVQVVISKYRLILGSPKNNVTEEYFISRKVTGDMALHNH